MVRFSDRGQVRDFKASGFTPHHTEYPYASVFAPAALSRALPYPLGKRRSKAQLLERTRPQLDLPLGLSVIEGFQAT